MAEHGMEFQVLKGIIQVMVDNYNTEMRNDIIREKAIRISTELREDKENLNAVADHLRSILASIASDTDSVNRLLASSSDQKTQTWGQLTLNTLAATGAYLTEYVRAFERAAISDPSTDLTDLFEACDNMRDAFEEQYELFVQVTGNK